MYAFESGPLRDALTRLSTANAQGEEYLTDVVGLFAAAGLTVGALVADRGRDRRGERPGAARRGAPGATTTRLLESWMRAGVTVVDPATTWVDAEVELAPDVILRPGVQLHGRTRVARGAEVGPDCTLVDTAVGERRPGDPGALRSAPRSGRTPTVGPFAYLRPGAGARPGQPRSGRTSRSRAAEIGPGAKVPHLSYVGDATIGAGTNIGAGHYRGEL